MLEAQIRFDDIDTIREPTFVCDRARDNRWQASFGSYWNRLAAIAGLLGIDRNHNLFSQVRGLNFSC